MSRYRVEVAHESVGEHPFLKDDKGKPLPASVRRSGDIELIDMSQPGSRTGDNAIATFKDIDLADLCCKFLNELHELKAA